MRTRIARKLGLPALGTRYYNTIPGSDIPVCARLGTSDAQVYNDIFVNRQYDDLVLSYEPRLIIDCGANVGYASASFLTRYPTAHVIAIEPEPGNFEICRRNLAPYEHRVSLFQCAVWSHDAGLKIDRGYRDGAEWSVQVRECRPGEAPDIEARSIGDILHNAAVPEIDILKMDIERSEAEVFARGYEPWLKSVKNIMIELHDEECRKVFFAAMRDYNFESFESGETVICKSITPKTP